MFKLGKLEQLLLFGKNSDYDVFRIGQTLFMFKDGIELKIIGLGKFKGFDVVSSLNHPRKGHTSLRRHFKTIYGIQHVIYYPRIHSKKGSYEDKN